MPVSQDDNVQLDKYAHLCRSPQMLSYLRTALRYKLASLVLADTRQQQRSVARSLSRAALLLVSDTLLSGRLFLTHALLATESCQQLAKAASCHVPGDQLHSHLDHHHEQQQQQQQQGETQSRLDAYEVREIVDCVCPCLAFEPVWQQYSRSDQPLCLLLLAELQRHMAVTRVPTDSTSSATATAASQTVSPPDDVICQPCDVKHPQCDVKQCALDTIDRSTQLVVNGSTGVVSVPGVCDVIRTAGPCCSVSHSTDRPCCTLGVIDSARCCRPNSCQLHHWDTAVVPEVSAHTADKSCGTKLLTVDGKCAGSQTQTDPMPHVRECGVQVDVAMVMNDDGVAHSDSVKSSDNVITSGSTSAAQAIVDKTRSCTAVTSKNSAINHCFESLLAIIAEKDVTIRKLEQRLGDVETLVQSHKTVPSTDGCGPATRLPSKCVSVHASRDSSSSDTTSRDIASQSTSKSRGSNLTSGDSTSADGVDYKAIVVKQELLLDKLTRRSVQLERMWTKFKPLLERNGLLVDSSSSAKRVGVEVATQVSSASESVDCTDSGSGGDGMNKVSQGHTITTSSCSTRQERRSIASSDSRLLADNRSRSVAATAVDSRECEPRNGTDDCLRPTVGGAECGGVVQVTRSRLGQLWSEARRLDSQLDSCLFGAERVRLALSLAQRPVFAGDCAQQQPAAAARSGVDALLTHHRLFRDATAPSPTERRPSLIATTAGASQDSHQIPPFVFTQPDRPIADHLTSSSRAAGEAQTQSSYRALEFPPVVLPPSDGVFLPDIPSLSVSSAFTPVHHTRFGGAPCAQSAPHSTVSTVTTLCSARAHCNDTSAVGWTVANNVVASSSSPLVPNTTSTLSNAPPVPSSACQPPVSHAYSSANTAAKSTSDYVVTQRPALQMGFSSADPSSTAAPDGVFKGSQVSRKSEPTAGVAGETHELATCANTSATVANHSVSQLDEQQQCVIEDHSNHSTNASVANGELSAPNGTISKLPPFAGHTDTPLTAPHIPPTLFTDRLAQNAVTLTGGPLLDTDAGAGGEIGLTACADEDSDYTASDLSVGVVEKEVSDTDFF